MTPAETAKAAIETLRNISKLINTSKHLQGQHDQRTHSPTGRAAIAREWERKPTTRREAHIRGGVKGGAVHLGTIAIPAIATAAIIRGAAALRFGVIGAGLALVIYEAPQFAFRVIEGSVREETEFDRERRERRERNKVTKAEDTETDKANRPIKRGDHLLVMYKKAANIGVYLGGDTARLINGPKFEDVRTSKQNRLKIANGQGVPSLNNMETTRRILQQVKREQEAIKQVAQRAKPETTEKVDKHGTHDQKDHAPKGAKQTFGTISSKNINFINQQVPGVKAYYDSLPVDKRPKTATDLITQFTGLQRKPKRKVLKNLGRLRDILTKLNRLTKEGVSATSVSGLELTREDLQDEMAHPHPGHVKKPKKGWATQPSFRLTEKLDMDDGVDTKHPYKNPEGANVESARYA